MSISTTTLPKKSNLHCGQNIETHKNFPKKFKKQISFQNDIYQKEIFKKLNEGSVLNFIRNSERKDTAKTGFSDSNGDVKYDLCMINKFDENLNSSLSFISEFDLEEDDKENNNSFNSIDDDNSVEECDIFKKNNNKKNVIDKNEDDEEHNTKLEKEWNDIQKLLLNKNKN